MDSVRSEEEQEAVLRATEGRDGQRSYPQEGANEGRRGGHARGARNNNAGGSGRGWGRWGGGGRGGYNRGGNRGYNRGNWNRGRGGGGGGGNKAPERYDEPPPTDSKRPDERPQAGGRGPRGHNKHGRPFNKRGTDRAPPANGRSNPFTSQSWRRLLAGMPQPCPFYLLLLSLIIYFIRNCDAVVVSVVLVLLAAAAMMFVVFVCVYPKVLSAYSHSLVVNIINGHLPFLPKLPNSSPKEQKIKYLSFFQCLASPEENFVVCSPNSSADCIKWPNFWPAILNPLNLSSPHISFYSFCCLLQECSYLFVIYTLWYILCYVSWSQSTERCNVKTLLVGQPIPWHYYKVFPSAISFSSKSWSEFQWSEFNFR